MLLRYLVLDDYEMAYEVGGLSAVLFKRICKTLGGYRPHVLCVIILQSARTVLSQN